MWLKIKNKFRYYKLCFYNWLNGDGFCVVLDPKSQCFYEYCAKIASHKNVKPIADYEERLSEFMKEEKITREAAAFCFAEAYKAILEGNV